MTTRTQRRPPRLQRTIFRTPRPSTPPRQHSDPPPRATPDADLCRYAEGEAIPDVPWLTKLRQSGTRRDVRCLTERTRLAKRITDLVTASALLVLLAPVMLLVALLVKLTSPGPVIFRQVRVGLNLRRGGESRKGGERRTAPRGTDRRTTGDRRRDSSYGRPFVLYKFRTMTVDAEKGGARFAVSGDPRVTPVGRFLRRTRLDELPQLVNVVRGEMSLVGPRPERPEFIEQLSAEIPDYLQRLGLKPGLTGLAQILNGYDNDIAGFRRKVAFDLLYLRHLCWWNDAKILLRTISVVLKGSGAL